LARRDARQGEALVTLELEKVGSRVGAEMHLEGIDLSLPAGSVTVLLGPTLSGKTSLLRVMAGLDRPTTGRVLVDGRDLTGAGVRRRNVAMVYQQFVNYPSLSVYENIASPLRMARKLDPAEIDRRVRATAQIMRIESLLDRLPGQLSGGQQQRTAIARALIKGADLLLLDEPLVNLDYKLREELRAEMREIFAHREVTVVYATTEPAEALMLGGNTVVLDAGRLIQFGPKIEVYHSPTSLRVGEIFSDPPMNLLPADLDGELARISVDVAFAAPAHMRPLDGGRYRIGVRANHVFLEPRAGGADAAALAVPATVELSEISGSETFVHARHNGLTLVVQREGVHRYELGQSVVLYIDPKRLYVFDEAGRLAAAPARMVEMS
jgi:glycerol transport system ATP-binding protein